MDESQYLEVFLDEANEHLRNLNNCITALETEPGKKDTINEVFRSVHSLKGMAGTMGFHCMQHLTQEIEELFDKAKSGRVKVTGGMLDILVECLEVLDKYIKNIKRTSHEGTDDNKALIKRLKEISLQPDCAKESSVMETVSVQASGDADKKEILSAASFKEEKKASENARASGRKEPNGRSITNPIVYVDAGKLDHLMQQVGELVNIKNSLVLAGKMDDEKFKDQVFSDQLEYLESITANLRETVMKIRLVPLERIVNKFPRMMCELSRKLNKKIELYMSGWNVELDRTAAEKIGDILWYLIRGMAEYGIESEEIRRKAGKPCKGAVYLNAFEEDGNIIIHISSDGNGIGKECGIHFDAVRSDLEALGGDMETFHAEEKTSEFIISLPLTFAIIQVLAVEIRQEKYAIALDFIQGIEEILPGEIRLTGTKEMILYKNMEIPFIRLEKRLDMDPIEEEPAALKTVIVKKGNRYAGLAVDHLIGQQEIVIKSLGKFIRSSKMIRGAAILGDGEVALVLDINAFV